MEGRLYTAYVLVQHPLHYSIADAAAESAMLAEMVGTPPAVQVTSYKFYASPAYSGERKLRKGVHEPRPMSQ
jgi:hypothetical protein